MNHYNKQKLIRNFHSVKLSVVLIFLLSYLVQAQKIDGDSTILYISEGTTVTNQENFSGEKIKLIHKNSSKSEKRSLTKKKYKKKPKKKTNDVLISSLPQKKKNQSSFFYQNIFSGSTKLAFAVTYTFSPNPKISFFHSKFDEIHSFLTNIKLNKEYAYQFKFSSPVNSSFFIRPPPKFEV